MHLQTLDIQRELFADKYQSFDVDGQSVVYLLQENTTAIARGVAVMMADSTVSVAAQEGFLPLANELNKLGWVTIILPAPDIAFTPKSNTTPIGSENSGTTPETENTDNPPTQVPTAEDSDNPPMDMDFSLATVDQIDPEIVLLHEQQMIALLLAAKEKSLEYPGFLLVIGKGTSAALLSKAYVQGNLTQPDALVTISPYWPARELNQQVPNWMANTPMPVFDIATANDNEWARSTTQARKISAIKALKLQYRQRILSGVASPQQSAYLSKEIYGWLSHMGW